MLYLLDTCIFSYLEDPESPYNERALSVLQSLTDEDDVCLSILSLYELEYGLKNAIGPALEYGGAVVSNDRIFTALRDLIPALSIADWTVA